MRRSGSLTGNVAAVAAAVALVAQLLLAGSALALPFDNPSGVACSNLAADGGASGPPTAPKHRHGVCCVFHHGPTLAPRAIGGFSHELSAAPLLFNLKFSKFALPKVPELAPSEARAPPGSHLI